MFTKLNVCTSKPLGDQSLAVDFWPDLALGDQWGEQLAGHIHFIEN